MNRLGQDLDKLMVFVAVAEKGKINQAAEALRLTQPSVSRAIQKLEESFGSPLFTRSRSGVKLTRAGELLYARAAKFLHELEDVRVQARGREDELAGHLSVGTYESLAEYLWPDFLQLLAKTHPQLHLSVKTNLDRDPIGELIAGRIDLLVDAEPQIRGELVSWPLYSDRFSFFVAPEFDIGDGTPATMRTRNISYHKAARDENDLGIEDHLRKQGFEFAREYTFDSFSTSKLLARKGMAIAVLPQRLAAEDGRKLKRVNLQGFKAEGFGRHTLYATVAAANEKDARLRKIIALLKAQFKA